MELRRSLVLSATLLAAITTAPAHAADDWLDEMPDVAKVAEVVDRAWAGSAARQSTVAINTAAALMLLRQLMNYRAAAEPAMSPERRARMQAIADSYLLAELAIGRSRGVRQGEPSAAELQRNYESRRYEKCATPACYQYWIRRELEYWGAFKFRQMLFPQLFPCGSAPAMLEIIQQHALEMPLIPFTPASPLPGDAAEMARLEQLATAPAACPADGADIDGDRQCHDWEAGLGLARTRTGPAIAACPVIKLENATTVDAESIRIRYTAGPGLAGQPIRLTACRATIQTLQKCEGPLTKPIGVETLSAPAQLAPGPHEETILRGRVLAPDTAMPYVIVVGEAAGETSQTYFKKWMLGVVVHGFTFKRMLVAATAVDEDLASDVREWLFRDEKPQEWQNAMVQSLEKIACYDSQTFAFSWQFASTLESRVALHENAVRLYDEIGRHAIDMVHQHFGDVVDVHLIGHSRGTIIASEVLKEWKDRPAPGLEGSYVRVTLLDPHPANNAIRQQEDVYFPDDSLSAQALYGWVHAKYRVTQDQIQDPMIELPGGIGIREAEVWFQHTRVKDILAAPEYRDADLPISGFNLWGLGATTGSHITSRTDRSISLLWRNLTNFRFDDGALVDHGGVTEYFQNHIDRNAVPGKCVMPPR